MATSTMQGRIRKPAIRPVQTAAPGQGGMSRGSQGAAGAPPMIKPMIRRPPNLGIEPMPMTSQQPAVDPNSAGDIQSAIGSLKTQLGMPGGPTPVPKLGGGPNDTAVGVTGPGRGEPPWMALQRAGIGGQGSPAANRAKLAELIAARQGLNPGNPGAGNIGIEPGPAVPGTGGAALGGPNNFRDFVGRIPNELPGGPGQGAAPPGMQGGQFGPDYLSLIRQRLGGLGGGGMGGPVAY